MLERSRRCDHERQRQAPLRDVLGRRPAAAATSASSTCTRRSSMSPSASTSSSGRSLMDAKYADVEAMPDGSIDLTLFSGGIRNTENAEHGPAAATQVDDPRRLRLVRQRGLHPRPGQPDHDAEPARPRLRGAVRWTTRTTSGRQPHDRARGRAPPAGSRRLLADARPGRRGRLPRARLPAGDRTDRRGPRAARGRPRRQGRRCRRAGRCVGAGHSHRLRRMPRATRHSSGSRSSAGIHELPPLDPSLCLLEQGVPCNGPATRDGCGAQCPLAGAPCIGCYGPADGVVDFGARLLSAFASVVDAERARPRSTGSSTACPTRSASSTASAWRDRCCAAVARSGPAPSPAPRARSRDQGADR